MQPRGARWSSLLRREHSCRSRVKKFKPSFNLSALVGSRVFPLKACAFLAWRCPSGSELRRTFKRRWLSSKALTYQPESSVLQSRMQQPGIPAFPWGQGTIPRSSVAQQKTMCQTNWRFSALLHLQTSSLPVSSSLPFPLFHPLPTSFPLFLLPLGMSVCAMACGGHRSTLGVILLGPSALSFETRALIGLEILY